MIEQNKRAPSLFAQDAVADEALRGYHYIDGLVDAVRALRYPYPSQGISDPKKVTYQCCALPGGSFDSCTEATYFSFHQWFEVTTLCGDDLVITYETEAEAKAKVDEIVPQIAENRLNLIIGEEYQEVLQGWLDINEIYEGLQKATHAKSIAH